MKKNGFTLVEILAVIIILGIIMIIAIPAVTKYILKSDKSVYADDIIAYLETARAEYEMKEYGTFLKDDEIMIVPIEYIDLEKGTKESPFGEFDLSKSYIVISPYKKGYQYYANVVDVQGIGVRMRTQEELNKDLIEENIKDKITSYTLYLDRTTTLNLNNNNYQMCEIRDIDTAEKHYKDAITVLCSTGDYSNPDEQNYPVLIKAENVNGEIIKSNKYTNSGLNFTFTKNGNYVEQGEIYYCRDTENKCYPDILVENNTEITDYNTITSNYYIRYRLVGISAVGNKEYSFSAKFDMEKPICKFEAAPKLYTNQQNTTLKLNCSDSLSGLQATDDSMMNAFSLSNNNLEIKNVQKESTKEGVT